MAETDIALKLTIEALDRFSGQFAKLNDALKAALADVGGAPWSPVAIESEHLPLAVASALEQAGFRLIAADQALSMIGPRHHGDLLDAVVHASRLADTAQRVVK